MLLRLFLDEIVEDLSRNGGGCEAVDSETKLQLGRCLPCWVEFAETFRPYHNRKLVRISR